MSALAFGGDKLVRIDVGIVVSFTSKVQGDAFGFPQSGKRPEEELTVATNYLLRTIQKRESPEWAETLNDDPAAFVPLSVEPKEEFDGLVIIHNGGAYVFDVDCVKAGDGKDVMCGEDEDQPVKAVVKIYVTLGSMQRFISLVQGFTGIRYKDRMSLLTVLAKPSTFYNNSGKGFWTHLEQFLGTVRPGQTLITTLDAVHQFIVGAAFVFPMWSMDIALDRLPGDFPFSLTRVNGSLHFTRK